MRNPHSRSHGDSSDMFDGYYDDWIVNFALGSIAAAAGSGAAGAGAANSGAQDQTAGWGESPSASNPSNYGGAGSGGARGPVPGSSSTEIGSAGAPVEGPGGTTAAVALSGINMIDGILSLVRWNGDITYAFPNNAADYGAGYPGNANNEGFASLAVHHQTVFNDTLNSSQVALANGGGGARWMAVEGFTNLGITSLAPTANAQLRGAYSTDPASAYAYYPGTNQAGSNEGGDSWYRLGTSYNYEANPMRMGSLAFLGTIHEIGHALGLKHGQEASNGNSTVLASDRDSLEFSVMTYRSYIGAPANGSGWFTIEEFGRPQSWMMADIAALQYMYGADFTHNGGNTTYTWSTTTGEMFVDGVGQGTPGANRIFLTIWDGNGTDTYNMSNYTNGVNVDLRPGMWSVTAPGQLANLNGGPNGGFARGNVFNALLSNGDSRSLIENAIGGIGNDTFTGNAANNTLNGNGGTDTVVFAQNRSAYTLTESNNHNYTYTLSGEGTDTLQSIERFQFLDITVTDDIIGGASTAQQVLVGTSNTGNHQFRGDSDWFGTSLLAGHNYVIRESGLPSAQGTLPDTIVRIHNFGGTTLFSNDDGGVGNNSELAVHVNSNGNYFVDADAFSSNLGTYTVSVQDLGVGAAASHFQNPPGIAYAGFSTGAGGWVNQNQYPRFLGNADGDDTNDIYGFGGSGVYIANNAHNGSGTFNSATLALAQFGDSGGWTDQEHFPRAIANVGGSGLSDIVGFGGGGVYVALATGTNTFGSANLALAQFGAAGGWDSQDHYPRILGQVAGTSSDDIVGFGAAGVYVAVADGSGGFAAAVSNPGIFGAAGGWNSQDAFPRLLADINGDLYQDIVGFGNAGAYVAIANGNGTYAAPTLATSQFGANTGWTSQNAYPRLLADVNQDGYADIVGFGDAGIYIATGNGGGIFNAAVFDFAGFNASGNWNNLNLYPRALSDVTGDNVPDLVAFGVNGAYIAQDLNFQII